MDSFSQHSYQGDEFLVSEEPCFRKGTSSQLGGPLHRLQGRHVGAYCCGRRE